jgi:hypothetical protein
MERKGKLVSRLDSGEKSWEISFLKRGAPRLWGRNGRHAPARSDQCMTCLTSDSEAEDAEREVAPRDQTSSLGAGVAGSWNSMKPGQQPAVLSSPMLLRYPPDDCRVQPAARGTPPVFAAISGRGTASSGARHTVCRPPNRVTPASRHWIGRCILPTSFTSHAHC